MAAADLGVARLEEGATLSQLVDWLIAHLSEKSAEAGGAKATCQPTAASLASCIVAIEEPPRSLPCCSWIVPL